MHPYRSENFEEHRRHLDAKGDGADGEDAEREGETPPSHIEGEWPAFVDGCQSEDEPHESEPPHDQRDEEAEDVNHVTGYVVENMGLLKVFSGYLSEIHDAKPMLSLLTGGNGGRYVRIATHAERPEWKKAAHNDFSRGQLVESKPLIVHHQNCHRQWHSHSPHYVRCDDRAKSMVRIREHFGNLGTRACCHDGGGDGKQLCSSNSVQRSLVLIGYAVPEVRPTGRQRKRISLRGVWDERDLHEYT